MSAGRLSDEERQHVLEYMGEIAQDKYDEYVVEGGNSKGYNLSSLQGSLQFIPDVKAFENDYYLEGDDHKKTEIAYYFEYGTGMFNLKNPSPIRASKQDFMKWKSKSGFWRRAKEVKGVYPILAMTKAVLYVKDYKKKNLGAIRGMIRNE